MKTILQSAKKDLSWNCYYHIINIWRFAGTDGHKVWLLSNFFIFAAIQEGRHHDWLVTAVTLNIFVIFTLILKQFGVHTHIFKYRERDRSPSSMLILAVCIKIRYNYHYKAQIISDIRACCNTYFFHEPSVVSQLSASSRQTFAHVCPLHVEHITVQNNPALWHLHLFP